MPTNSDLKTIDTRQFHYDTSRDLQAANWRINASPH